MKRLLPFATWHYFERMKFFCFAAAILLAAIGTKGGLLQKHFGQGHPGKFFNCNIVKNSKDKVLLDKNIGITSNKTKLSGYSKMIKCILERLLSEMCGVRSGSSETQWGRKSFHQQGTLNTFFVSKLLFSKERKYFSQKVMKKVYICWRHYFKSFFFKTWEKCNQYHKMQNNLHSSISNCFYIKEWLFPNPA